MDEIRRLITTYRMHLQRHTNDSNAPLISESTAPRTLENAGRVSCSNRQMGNLFNQNKHQECHLSMFFSTALTVFHLLYLLLPVHVQ